ncbi:MAG TPA: molybdopterin converting factor subunit 1 [Telluria sp.]|nr:molybdopterin converting factor subunit 1 [Telluria sp.]
MNIKLRYFASVRETLDISHEKATIPEGITTVGGIRAHLAARGGIWEEALGGSKPLRMAYNQVMCEPGQVVEPGAEVAFFPPVTGG